MVQIRSQSSRMLRGIQISVLLMAASLYSAPNASGQAPTATSTPEVPAAVSAVQESAPAAPQEPAPPLPRDLSPLEQGAVSPPAPASAPLSAPAPLSTPRADVSLSRQQGLYILGPGDVVQVDIFNVPEFSGAQQILLDGTVSLPLAGTVILDGLTLQQAADEIGFRLSAFLERPIVNVSLNSARPLDIAVVGEVRRPGSYTASAGEVPTVTELIQQAGGITQTADIRRIQVRRVGVNGNEQNFTIDLWALLQAGDPRRDLGLLDGDSIYVPTASAIAPEEASDLAAANFSPDQITVNIIGEVERSGTVSLPTNASLNQALLAAGGFTPRADTYSVDLIRVNPNGSVTKREIPVNLAQGLNEQTNPTLLNSDVITVRKTGIAQVAESIGVITQPLIGIRTLVNLVEDGF